MKSLKHGLALVLPFIIVYIIIKWLLSIVDSFFSPLIYWIFKKLSLEIKNKSIITSLELFLFFLFILFILLIGKIRDKGGFKKLFSLIESLFFKIPLVKTIYTISSKFSRSLFSKDSVSFKKVVLIEFPRPGSKILGFFVGYDKKDIIGKNKALVFVPTIPNPTTGFLFFVDIDSLEFVDISVEEGLKIIFSGGIYLLEE